MCVPVEHSIWLRYETFRREYKNDQHVFKISFV